MSKRIVQVKADTRIPSNDNIFALRGFSEETMLETNLGPIPAKDLTTHHLIRSMNGTYLSVEVVQRLELDASDLKRFAHLKPVLLKAGQFGLGAPRRDTLVSRDHTIWSGEKNGKGVGFFGSSAMWAHDPDQLREHSFSFTYIAFACERAGFIRAEGLWFAI